MAQRVRFGPMARAVAIAVFAGACSSTEGPPTGPSFVMTSLVIEGPPGLDLGATATFKAILRYYPHPDPRTRDVSQDVQWGTSDPSVLSIDRGVATAHADGTALLNVRLPDGTSGVRHVVVGSGSPLAPPPTIAVGQTVSSTVTNFSDAEYLLTPTTDGTVIARLDWLDPGFDTALGIRVDGTEFPAQPTASPPVTARFAVRSGEQYRLTVAWRGSGSFTEIDFVLTTAME